MELKENKGIFFLELSKDEVNDLRDSLTYSHERIEKLIKDEVIESNVMNELRSELDKF